MHFRHFFGLARLSVTPSRCLQAVEAGEIPRNHQILREIAGLCSRLPIGSDSTAGTKFLKNTNDALLISYMAMMTKGFNAMSEVSG